MVRWLWPCYLSDLGVPVGHQHDHGRVTRGEGQVDLQDVRPGQVQCRYLYVLSTLYLQYVISIVYHRSGTIEMEEIADLLETLYETAGFSTQAVATRAADLFSSLDLNQVQRLKSETHLKSEIWNLHCAAGRRAGRGGVCAGLHGGQGDQGHAHHQRLRHAQEINLIHYISIVIK